MDLAIKFVDDIRGRRMPRGAILLEDGKKICDDVVCTRGALVKVWS